MILSWRDSNYTPHEQLIGTVYDAGVIMRNDLLLLLGWSHDKLKRHTAQFRREYGENGLHRFRDSKAQYGYYLDEFAQKWVTEFLQLPRKPEFAGAQKSHTLGINAILLRHLERYGREGVSWYSTQEAADELLYLRKATLNASDADLRGSAIRPDAAIKTPESGWAWLEFDNATEGSRVILKKFQMYIVNLADLHESLRRVVWVTTNETRRRRLQQIFDGMEEETGARMEFYVQGDEDFGKEPTDGAATK